VFAATEQRGAELVTRLDEVADKVRRVRAWLEERQLAGVVLGGVDAVAWLGAGLVSPVERGVPVGPVRVVVTPTELAAVTTSVERPRLVAEAGLDELGIPLYEAPWYEDGGLERVAVEIAGSSRAELACDSAAGFRLDCGDDIIGLRLALGPLERERLEQLARDTSAALEGALRSWRPGEKDCDLLGRVDEALAVVGAFAPCLIVGGDERVERFRHPLASGAPMRRLVMAVAVAERGGLHVAATRFACVDGLSDSVRAAQDAARGIEERILAACRPGATYGEVVDACARAYSDAGHAGAWQEHYQGGPIGYRQREFELAPGQTASRWWRTPLEAGHALAWNPSIAGGGKSEDTYLLEPAGLRRLTDSGGWPLLGGRPAVLDLETGEAA
jgi:Xaa-Pro dipeptidase